MLKTIDFIKNNENWRELLKESPYCLSINEDDNYALLKYSQVDSDFNEQICKECRGLIIDLHTLEPVALSFYKFFNVQETFADKIYWKDCKVLEKVDGSKMLVWFNKYEDKWQISTSGMLNAYNATVSDFGKTFGQLFDRALLNYNFPNSTTLYDNLDKQFCYTFELVSPESRVVVPYKKDDLYLIGVRNIITFEELNPTTFELSKYFKIPKQYNLPNLKSCLEATKHMGFDEEGFVVVDKHWHRIKIKSPAYISAHYLKNNGVNSRSRVLSIIEAGERDEFLSLFPEYTEIFNEVGNAFTEIKLKILNAIDNIDYLTREWLDNKDKRKLLAEYINGNYPDISGILFSYLNVDLVGLFIHTKWKELSKDKKMKLLGFKMENEDNQELD
jgi:hypothetical protein